ncbi:EAL domain-containing protein [Escherichia coli]|uniref:EAL domain-containing protein n=1 Tax=Escherichia coli TaxID=562 RepID=UPI000376D2CB|nr:EAL domain-containing protein [Escherichia coli]EEQ1553821.1 EAL domain-containing protein [Escherichia coli]EEW5974538.1 EAL domain-containing protein [Escherichia coli]EFD7673150.1 EAL domain-containing protein [Escherichia coli]EFE8163326.1 EAL domain-containing protein [Escherichia coli]EFE9364381.1 EAL domain-containing protein [Escherichia coli]
MSDFLYQFTLEPSKRNGKWHSWVLLTKNITNQSAIFIPDTFILSSLNEQNKTNVFEAQLELINTSLQAITNNNIVSINVDDLLTDHILNDTYIYDYLFNSRNIALEINEYFHEFRKNTTKDLEALSLLCPIWLDDYGSGYTNSKLLKRFEFNCLKIDKDMFWENENKLTLSTLCNLIFSYCNEITIEGIETDKQRDLIYSIGGVSGQGRIWKDQYINIDM